MSPDNEDNQLSNRPKFDEERAEPENLSLSNQQDVAEQDGKISNGGEEVVLDLRTFLEESLLRRREHSSSDFDMDELLRLLNAKLDSGKRLASGSDSGSFGDTASDKKLMTESTVQKYSSNDKAKGKNLIVNEERTVHKSNERRSLDTLVDTSPPKNSKSEVVIDPSSRGVQFERNLRDKKFLLRHALSLRRTRASDFIHRVILHTRKYYCHVCPRSFSSIYALCSHRTRDHVSSAGQTPPSQSTPTAEGINQASSVGPFDFDVNDSHVTPEATDQTPPPSQSTSTAEGKLEDQTAS